MEGNSIQEQWLVEFLKLLNDISSINETDSSIHRIINLGLPRTFRVSHLHLVRYISFAFNMNRIHKKYQQNRKDEND